MAVKLLTEHYLEFLSCSDSFESTLVKMSHCRKSHVAAHLLLQKAKPAQVKFYFKVKFHYYAAT